MAVDANLGKASVAVRATLDRLDGDLSDARGRVDSAVQRMARGAGRAFQNLGKVALGGIGMATGATVGLAGALGKLAVDAAPVEGISEAFEGLAESADYGADEMLGALERGSSGMIAQRDLMLSFNKAASLVSTDFATQLPDAMQYLGKVSASTGQDLDFLLDSLVTGVGRVSPMILDNLGIQVAQAEATERAAEMFGVEAAQLDKTQVQAGMMNVVLEKLAANTASMPDITDSAAARMAQFRATMQNTKDQIGMALLPVLNTLMTVFGTLAATVLPPLVSFIEGTLAPVLQGLAWVFQDLLSGVLGRDYPWEDVFPPSLAQIAYQISAAVFSVIDAVRGIIEAVSPYIAIAAQWIGENVKIQDVLIALGAAIGSVVIPAIASIVGAVAPVIAVFLAVTAIVAALRTAWETNFLGIRDIAATVWGWLQMFIPQALNRIQTIFNTVVTAIQTFWANHGQQIMTTAQEMWDKVMAIFNWFKAQYTQVFQAFRMAFQGDWRGFGEKLREVWDEAWSKIQEIGEKTWNAIKTFFTETDWGSVGRSILEGIAKGITGALDIIKNAAKNAAQAALDAAKGFLGIDSPSKRAQQEIGEPYSQGLGKGVQAAIPQVARAARRTTQAMMDAAAATMWRQRMPQPANGAEAPTTNGASVVIYGLTLEGVQDRDGLLAELQALT